MKFNNRTRLCAFQKLSILSKSTLSVNMIKEKLAVVLLMAISSNFAKDQCHTQWEK